MATLFNTNMDFLGDLFSVKGLFSIGIAFLAIIALYLLIKRFSASTKSASAKVLSIAGFTESEVSTLVGLGDGLVKTAGLATAIIIAGKYVPLLDPFSNVGSLIMTLLGWYVSLALPVAVVYLARRGVKDSK